MKVHFRALVLSALASVIVVSTASLLLTHSALAQDEVTVEILPGRIAVPTNGQSVQALVVVHNATTSELTEVRLSWFGGDNICVNRFQSGCPADLSGDFTILAGMDSSWSLRLTASEFGSVSGTMYVRLNYVSDGIAKIKTSSLELTPLTPQPLEGTTSIELVTSMSTLSELHSGRAYLTVKNQSNDTLFITDVVMRGPSFIAGRGGEQEPNGTFMDTTVALEDKRARTNDPEAQLTEAEKTKELRPGASIVYLFDVRAGKGVSPGKHALLFSVDYYRIRDRQQGHLAVSRDLDVSVFGESDISKIIEVPSFWLFPGFVAMITIGSILGLKILEPKSPALYVFSIAFSFVMAFFLYPIATFVLSQLPVVNDYVRGTRQYISGTYSFEDIALAWGLSLAVGAGVSLAVLFVRSRTKQAGEGNPPAKPSILVESIAQE